MRFRRQSGKGSRSASAAQRRHLVDDVDRLLLQLGEGAALAGQLAQPQHRAAAAGAAGRLEHRSGGGVHGDLEALALAAQLVDGALELRGALTREPCAERQEGCLVGRRADALRHARRRHAARWRWIPRPRSSGRRRRAAPRYGRSARGAPATSRSAATSRSSRRPRKKSPKATKAATAVPAVTAIQATLVSAPLTPASVCEKDCAEAADTGSAAGTSPSAAASRDFRPEPEIRSALSFAIRPAASGWPPARAAIRTNHVELTRSAEGGKGGGSLAVEKERNR